MASFNWDSYWAHKDESRSAQEFAVKLAKMLRCFIEDETIWRIADYGCGPATTLFALAAALPDVSFYGYDVAGSVVEKNTSKARSLGLRNLFFRQDRLPNPKNVEKFGLVTCFSTLHYTEDIEQALRDLYGLVEGGGYLIFNYPNRYTRKMYVREIKPGDEEMRRRFSLVLEGRNLLSVKAIEGILGVRPLRFYSSRRSNPYVVARKGKSRPRGF